MSDRSLLFLIDLLERQSKINYDIQNTNTYTGSTMSDAQLRLSQGSLSEFSYRKNDAENGGKALEPSSNTLKSDELPPATDYKLKKTRLFIATTLVNLDPSSNEIAFLNLYMVYNPQKLPRSREFIHSIRSEIEKLKSIHPYLTKFPDKSFLQFMKMVSVCQSLFEFEIEINNNLILKLAYIDD